MLFSEEEYLNHPCFIKLNILFPQKRKYNITHMGDMEHLKRKNIIYYKCEGVLQKRQSVTHLLMQKFSYTIGTVYGIRMEGD